MTNYSICFGTYYEYLRHDILPDKACDVEISKFNDGEISVKFKNSLRGHHLFIFGETTHNLTELILTIDAAKRSSVKEITIVLPYYGYARQDKRESTRGCIGASAIANVLQGMGINRVISIDLHAEQIQGMFNIPFEHLSGKGIFFPWMRKQDLSNAMICSPDAGGIQRATAFAKEFNLPMAMINKHRDKPGSIASMLLIGDVKGKVVYKIDDILDTGGTMIKSDDYLKEMGALDVINVITHSIASGDATEKIINNGSKLITTDTLNTYYTPGYSSILKVNPEYISVLSCANWLKVNIERIANEESISELTYL